MTDDTLIVHLKPTERAKLDALAAATATHRDAIVAEAISTYLDAEEAWIGRVTEGLRQADAGEFASEEQVAKVFGRFR